MNTETKAFKFFGTKTKPNLKNIQNLKTKKPNAPL